MTPPETVLRQFGLSAPVEVAETAIAHVWKVRRDNGFAALKIYKNGDPKGEDVGFRLMQALDGAGMARVFDATDAILVMEWLDGPSLGDLCRNGHDDAAAARLIKVADTIHGIGPVDGLTPLATQFSALLTLDMNPDWPEQFRRDMQRAQILACDLLNKQQEITALHGDLHHDNIKTSPRGDLAFDPKGLIGDRAYDLANAFRNPLGAPDLVGHPARARRLAHQWGQHWKTSPRRLLSWAAAHMALSITWARNFHDPAETGLLAMFLSLRDAA